MGKQSKDSKNIIGNRYGRLVVVAEVPREERKGSHCEYVCKCDCGKTTIVEKNNLVSGGTKSCGCYKREKARLATEKYRSDIIGKRFGRLTVVSEVPKDEWKYNKHREFFCICDCGNTLIVPRIRLITGNTKSCGCYKKDYLSNQWEDISGQQFGELTAIRRVKSVKTKSGHVITKWLFKCSCGEKVIASISNIKNGEIHSCGHIGHSIAEYEINKWLMQNNINYTREATFEDLINPKTQCRLRLDFKIFRNDGSFFIIEHHGIQHFLENNRYGKQQREETDKIKKEYCQSKGITLYETLYNEDYISKLEDIIANEIMRDGDAYGKEVSSG